MEKESNKVIHSTLIDLKRKQIDINNLEDANDRLTMKIKALREFVPPFELLIEREIENARKSNFSLTLCMIGIDNFIMA